VPEPAINSIRRHGEETYPHECCGALLGNDGAVIETLPLPNTTDEGPRKRFRIAPAEYLAAERRARATGRELLGFYHSHPDAPARPSAYDLEHAWPNFSYIIISVLGGKARDATSWRLRGDRSSFDPEPISETQ